MSRLAIETFSTFGVGILCLVVAIMALAVFFQLFNLLFYSGAKPETLAVHGVLKKGTWATVHTTGAETFKRVRFLGFTSSESIKSRIPMDLAGMVILEDEAGRRFLIRAKAIRTIEIEPEKVVGNLSVNG